MKLTMLGLLVLLVGGEALAANWKIRTKDTQTHETRTFRPPAGIQWFFPKGPNGITYDYRKTRFTCSLSTEGKGKGSGLKFRLLTCITDDEQSIESMIFSDQVHRITLCGPSMKSCLEISTIVD